MDPKNPAGFSVSENTSFLQNRSGSNLFVYFCTFAANLLIVTCGFGITFPSSIIPKLQSDDPEVNPLSAPMTAFQISLLVGFSSIGGCLSFIITPKLSDTIGRKKILVIEAAALILSFTTIAFVKEIKVYYICVFLNGYFECSGSATVSVYVSEIVETKNRGKLCGISAISLPIGSLLGYGCGAASIRTVSLISTVFPILFLLCSYFIPESPIFLAMRGREIQCLKSLELLRGTNNVEAEYEKMKERVNVSTKTKLLNILDLFKDSISLKSFLLSLELGIVQTATGITLIGIFMAPIFNEAGSYLSGNFIGVVGASTQVIIVSCSSLFIDRLGRRPLLLTSCLCCIFSLFILGLYFYLKNAQIIVVQNLRWLTILCVVFYYSGYSIGVGPITGLVVCELLSNELRAVGTSTVYLLNNIWLSAMLFSFPILSEIIGVHFCLWILCLCSTIGFFMVCFTIPETKGKSFTEIQDNLGRKAK